MHIDQYIERKLLEMEKKAQEDMEKIDDNLNLSRAIQL